MENFLYSLAVAAISALAWIAYKYPAGYNRLAPWLLGGVLFSLLIFSLSNTFFLRGALSAHKYYEVNKPFDFSVFEGMLLATPSFTIVVMTLLFIYIVILWFLPNILGIDQDEKVNKKKDKID